MKEKTRDNLFYLAVGLSIVALIVADLFYSNSHDRKMWWPSTFALRAIYTTALLVYFVVRETFKLKARRIDVIAGVLAASMVHLLVIFGFRQTIGQLSGVSFSGLAILEIFFVFQFALQVSTRLSKKSAGC